MDSITVIARLMSLFLAVFVFQVKSVNSFVQSSSRMESRYGHSILIGDAVIRKTSFFLSPPCLPKPGRSPAGPKKFIQIREQIIPSIPPQDDLLENWTDHFRPRFVAREFLYGCRYMCQIYFYLLVVASLGHFLRRSSLPLLLNKSWNLRLEDSDGPFKHLEHYAKLGVDRLFGIVGIVDAQVIRSRSYGPIMEELAYRGLGQYIGSLLAVSSLGIISWTCHVQNRSFAIGVMSMDALIHVACLRRHFWSLPLGYLGLQAWTACIQKLILLPAVVHLIRATTPEPNADDARNTGLDPKNKNRSQQGMTTNLPSLKKNLFSFFDLSHIWARHKPIETPSSSDVSTTNQPNNCDRAITLAISRSARFFGAKEFGLAHGPIAGDVPWQLHWYFLQKSIGTFFSSLLVESRLVIQRRTLWGALGAHVAYNTISDLSPFAVLIAQLIVFEPLHTTLEQLGYLLDVSILYLPLLYISQRWVVRLLKQIEVHVSGTAI